ncbi:TM2 domain-containing protein almondex [Orussus abietinus]|uniref:TM2 domain-containing protein almondex n=1 Tax=Orussus abietinus TaxID=222816 RepID=UPI0006250271|nr:TM2 domain-containing protein almondex [Orussus abietinus]
MSLIQDHLKYIACLIIIFLTGTTEEVYTNYEGVATYALKETNTNSTPVYNKKEEILSLCPVGILCTELGGDCLKCTLNTNCIYGANYTANCTVLPQVDCIGEQHFQKKYICRYCYQTEHWEHECHQKNSCSSVASPQQYYRTNCTVKDDILCLGRRTFMKNLPCNWTGGHRWSTALILSITLGGFGADRFYLGHWQIGLGKLFSFGGFGVWTLIDVVLISIHYLGPADGSLYI